MIVCLLIVVWEFCWWLLLMLFGVVVSFVFVVMVGLQVLFVVVVQVEVDGIVWQFLVCGGDFLVGVLVFKVVVFFMLQLFWIVDDGSVIYIVEWLQCFVGMQGFFVSFFGELLFMLVLQFFYEVFNVFLVFYEMLYFVDVR